MSEQLLAIVIEAALRATLLAIFVGALLWLLKVPRGAPRHTAWLIVVIAMFLMPALQRLTPALPAPLTPRVPDLATLIPLPGPLAPAEARALVPSAAPVNASSGMLPEPVQAAPSSANQTASVSRIGWLEFAAAVYALIAVGLLLRIVVALGAVWTIYRRARPIGDGLFESSAIVTPVTVGLIRPRIVLPVAWTGWPESTRLAVVAHERAHAKRRDPLVALLTRLNSCVFWFHPLAWWLERTLADASEQACDEVGVQAVPHPRQYAEVLLAMATASRQAGGRIVWAGVSVEGRGRLSHRIDRILLGQNTTSISHARKLLVAAGCVVAVTAAVACRSNQPPPPPLVADETPQRVEQQKESERYQAVRTAAHAMTWEQVAEFEAQWRRDPENLAVLEKLLFFYEPDISGKHSPDDPKKIVGRRPLILWLIEHHPDSKLIQQIPGRIFPPGDWLSDPQGYEAAKKLWLAHAARPDVTADTLRTAAAYLDVVDKAIAEKLLLQGQQQYPGNTWSSALGRLYAVAILGSNRFTLFNVIHSTSPADARGAFASRARTTLEASTDPVLLTSAGGFLVRSARQVKVDFDHLALGRAYLERAMRLDPKSETTRNMLEWMALGDHVNKEQQLLKGVSPESRPDVIAKLPESERLAVLVRQAGSEYMGAESHDWSAKRPQSADETRPEQIEENRQKAREAWQRSKKYAQDALDLTKRLPNHPDHPDALFGANIALGANAFREGDRKAAVRYMLSAADAPPSSYSRRGSPVLMSGYIEDRLIGPLLTYGERETVIQYFERSAEKRPLDRERLLAAATAIRNGKLPSNYQRR